MYVLFVYYIVSSHLKMSFRPVEINIPRSWSCVIFSIYSIFMYKCMYGIFVICRIGVLPMLSHYCIFYTDILRLILDVAVQSRISTCKLSS